MLETWKQMPWFVHLFWMVSGTLLIAVELVRVLKRRHQMRGETAAPDSTKKSVSWWLSRGLAAVMLAGLVFQTLVPTGLVRAGEDIHWAPTMELYSQKRMKALRGTELSILYEEEGQGAVPRDVKILEARVTHLEQDGTTPILEPRETLEAWRLGYEVRLDVEEPARVVLTDPMTESDGWFDVSGPRWLVMGRECSSGDVYFRDEMAESDPFLADYDSGDEALFDWYLRENGLPERIPPCRSDWDGVPVHREDGDGWYLYVPADWTADCSRPDAVTWTAPGGETLRVRRLPVSAEAAPALLGEQSVFLDDPAGGCYQVACSGGQPGDLLHRAADSFRIDDTAHAWEAAYSLEAASCYDTLDAAVQAALWQDLPGAHQQVWWQLVYGDQTESGGTVYGVALNGFRLADPAVMEGGFLLPAAAAYNQTENGWQVTQVTLPAEGVLTQAQMAEAAEGLLSRVPRDLRERVKQGTFGPVCTFTDNTEALAAYAAEARGATAELLQTEILARFRADSVLQNQVMLGTALHSGRKAALQHLLDTGIPADPALPTRWMDEVTIHRAAMDHLSAEMSRAGGSFTTEAHAILTRAPLLADEGRVCAVIYTARYELADGVIRETASDVRGAVMAFRWDGRVWQPEPTMLTADPVSEGFRVREAGAWMETEEAASLTGERIAAITEDLRAQCRTQAEAHFSLGNQ